jgi:RNA polymerase II subunit A C-terminal domain phosphatase SSU72
MKRASNGSESDSKRADLRPQRRLSFAVVCSSNQNRSMEAHARLRLMNICRESTHPNSKAGYSVKSYGAGQCIKLPGPSADKPNVYEFGKVTYEEILQDLSQKDLKL